MGLDSPSRDTRIVSTTTTSVTMTAAGGWQDLQETGSFNQTTVGPIIVHWCGVHSYEAGATNMWMRAIVKYANNAQATASGEYQVAKQGLGSNYAFGNHSFFWIFHNMPIHNGYKVLLQGNNKGSSSTTHISNYFAPNTSSADQLIVSYQA